MKIAKLLLMIIIVSSVIGCGGGGGNNGGGGGDDSGITGDPVWNAGIGFVGGSITKIGAASSSACKSSLQEIGLK